MLLAVSRDPLDLGFLIPILPLLFAAGFSFFKVLLGTRFEYGPREIGVAFEILAAVVHLGARESRTKRRPERVGRGVRRGITMTETMVVAAILAVLAAILVPAFARAGVEGRRTACASRLRQFGAAIRLYQGDHDGHGPVFAPGAIPEDRDRIFAPLGPYLRSFEVAECVEPYDPVGHEGAVRSNLFQHRYLVQADAGGARLRTLALEPGNVLAFCENHTRGIVPGRTIPPYIGGGSHLFVREDLSAGRVQGDRLGVSWFGPTGWHHGAAYRPAPGDAAIVRFPSEPWPPRLDR